MDDNNVIASKKESVEDVSDDKSFKTTNKLKLKTPIAILSIITGFLLFGVCGFFVGRWSVTKTSNNAVPHLSQLSPTQAPGGNSQISDSKKYENKNYGLEFAKPTNYIVTTEPDCSSLVFNKAQCLLALTIDPDVSSFLPNAHFWLLKGIDVVDIPGQVSDVRYDSTRKAWVVNKADNSFDTLSTWSQTQLGQDIIKTSNGGSGGSSYYYLIPEYDSDEVAIFSIPQSYRLRCDSFTNDKVKENDCNNFYNSVVNQYGTEQQIADTWLPDNYISTVYSGAENMIKSYRDVVSYSTKAISTLDNIPEVQKIKKSITDQGRKPFYTFEGVRGDVVNISLRESYPNEPQTSRIDSFFVNVIDGTVTVENIVNSDQIPLKDWIKNTN